VNIAGWNERQLLQKIGIKRERHEVIGRGKRYKMLSCFYNNTALTPNVT
jgi:hypothetical protein